MTATAFVPADQDVRDAITERTDENMLVEAGAGTGKTTVLVDRIVRILADGKAGVHELVVITFTEKAAAELAGRVRQGLETALGASASEDERARLAAALRDLNRAHIETIHAFAASLLRERPIEAGLDPGFDVLDTLPSQLEFDAAWTDWITAETAADPPPDALVDALNVGLDFKHVREAAERLNAHRDVLPLQPYAAVRVDPLWVLREFGGVVTDLLDSRVDCRNNGDGGLANIEALGDAYDDMAPLAGRPEALVRAICNVASRKWSLNAGTQPNWVTPARCKQVKATIKDAVKLLQDAREDIRQAATADLVHWLAGFVTYYTQRRKEAGKADFDDLLIWARDLVRNPDVRRYFQSKYRSILVDEFQDTDPLQVEMIVSLCAAGDLPEDWRTAKIRPASLFVVGDPKQSIYRFRRADIAMYDAVKRHIFNDAPKLITQNFRSVQPLIEWVNGVFPQIMRRQEGIQPAYVPLVHHPEFRSSEAVTVLKAEYRPFIGKATEDTRRTEANAIAAALQHAMNDGAWSVRDRTTKQARGASFRDIVILIPSRTQLELYEDALARAGIPYRHEGGRTFFVRQEVRELISVLRAIDDPGDGVATVAALRSSAFGCSDEDLLLWKANGGSFNLLSVRDEAAGVVADSLRTLRDIARRRSTLALPVLVRNILDSTRMVEFAMLQPQGEQVAANLLKVIDQARAYAEAANGGLRGFVRWLKENLDRSSDETDAPISEETDDVVRIMTIHAAKGLEFPIVVFANMATKRADRTNVIADRDGGRLHVKLGPADHGFRTPGYDAVSSLEQAHSRAEELRQLYVAATRARDRLVVPFVENVPPPKNASPGPDSLSDWLRAAEADQVDDALLADDLPPIANELPVWRRDPAFDGAGADAVIADAVIALRQGWLADHGALIEGAKKPLMVHTATALKPEWTRETPGGDGVRRGRATDFGSAVHALLERVDLRAEPDVKRLAPAIAIEFGLLGREAEIADVARRALGSSLIDRARRSARALQEAPFTIALPDGVEGVAEGRMDLLFEEGGGLVVADFKTDAVTGADVDDRAAFYRNQALIYAWAASRASGVPVREVIFLFARPEPAIEVAYAVDDAFMAEAAALLQREPVVAEA